MTLNCLAWPLLFSLAAISLPILGAAPASNPPRPADQALADYFRAETAKLSERCLAHVKRLDDWQALRARYRQELLEMLGLSPLPKRSPLKAVVTGGIEHEEFTVENLHFQSRPGLYVTANLYLPKGLTQPAPAVLYVCGHGPVISNKVSYGNKVTYQHHGAWFARHGYVCLIIDTVQLGEILGLHHGTYREGMWWWNARGYTPAGVEAWNSIRALDYLSTRPEVDTNRFGITGRSGGGAYSWTAAALDDRIKAVAPVAGITDLENHVVDGVVEGHCDCMFIVNTYRWDYPLLAALVAPRPLLLVNTDSDSIFPLDGVMRTHAKVKALYGLHRADSQFGLVIGPGPHKDTQNLQVPVFRWFNQHLRREDPPVEVAAVKLFKPEQLKVFRELPADAINTNVHARFVPRATPATVPSSAQEWRQQAEAWVAALKEKSFGGWPEEPGALHVEKKFTIEREGLRLEGFDFTSQPHVRLRLYALQSATWPPSGPAVLNVLGPPRQGRTAAPVPEGAAGRCPTFDEWLAIMRAEFEPALQEELAATTSAPSPDAAGFAALRAQLQKIPSVQLYLAPRGLGLTAWSGNAREQTHIRRRFMLLGQTLEGMRVWDIRRAVQAIRTQSAWNKLPLSLRAEDDLAADALYAALFEPNLAGLDLRNLPASHDHGPDFLNVLRILDMPQTAAMVAERCRLRLHGADARAWDFPLAVARALGWPAERLQTIQEKDFTPRSDSR